MIWEKVKTWGLVALALVGLFFLGQWRRARQLVQETKQQLAEETARRKAAAESAARERDLKASHSVVDATLEEHLAAIAVKQRQDLDAEAKAREEVNSASTDVDDLIALGRKKRKEGKLR